MKTFFLFVFISLIYFVVQLVNDWPALADLIRKGGFYE